MHARLQVVLHEARARTNIRMVFFTIPHSSWLSVGSESLAGLQQLWRKKKKFSMGSPVFGLKRKYR